MDFFFLPESVLLDCKLTVVLEVHKVMSPPSGSNTMYVSSQSLSSNEVLFLILQDADYGGWEFSSSMAFKTDSNQPPNILVHDNTL